MVFEIYAKIFGQTPMFYFRSGNHVFIRSKIESQINFVQITLRNNHTELHPNSFSSSRGEDFFQNDDDDGRQRMQSDGNSSIGLRPGELKKLPARLSWKRGGASNFADRGVRLKFSNPNRFLNLKLHDFLY